MDATGLTQTADAVVGAVSSLPSVSPSQLLDLLVATAGGGIAVEQALEKFGIDKAPAAIKPYIPALITIGGGTLVSMKAGMPWQTALMVGAGTYVASQLKHDMAPAATPASPVAPIPSPAPLVPAPTPVAIPEPAVAPSPVVAPVCPTCGAISGLAAPSVVAPVAPPIAPAA